MAIKRTATAVWKGTGAEGKGTLDTSNNFFDQTPYSAKSRFENEDGKKGTNPEELIAAAHAACFAMALSFAIAKAGFVADEIKTDATVALEKNDSGFAISGIILNLEGKVSGMEKTQFMELAKGAKNNCPISKALSAVPIDLKAKFIS